MQKLLIITYLLVLHIFNSQAQWAQEGNNLLGKMQYYHGGSLGYGVRTSEGGGWAWQFVDGINNHYFHVEYPTGNVGVGTNSPTSKLDVHGEIFSNNNPITLRKGTTGQFVGFRNYGTISHNDNIVAGDLNSISSFSANRPGTVMTIRNVGTGPSLTIPDGYVGIGTTTPDAELTVKGTIHTEEVKIDLTGALVPDFVFEEAYELRTLKDTKAFIMENKHLPEVPSAAMMKENGIDVKSMNLKLLQKIEELTLYIIDQNERIEKLEEGIAMLEK